jgi:hypothetical protein
VGEWSAARPGRTLYPPERIGTYCTGGWVGPGPVWTGAEKLIPNGIRSPDLPARGSVAIPTELPGPQAIIISRNMFEN